jgi:hypothetical protein
MIAREFPRFRVQFRSSFTSAQIVAGEGTIVDLSIRGCRVESGTSVPASTNLELRIYLAGQDALIDIESAAVRWSMGREFGLEFIRMQSEQQARLRLLVEDLKPPSSA